VVYYVPDRPTGPVEPLEETAEMATRGKEFEPRVLTVPRGSTVAFPNRDPILHNVFSVSDPYRFDLGLYGGGDSESVTFDRPGVVRVFCNVHHEMVGYVLVLDTRHSARPDAQGRFRLTGLPAGEGELTVWHEQAEPWTRRIRIPAGTVAVRLELTKPKIPPHRNKFGRSYRRFGRNRYDGH
jgi:plastocyanin